MESIISIVNYIVNYSIGIRGMYRYTPNGI